MNSGTHNLQGEPILDEPVNTIDSQAHLIFPTWRDLWTFREMLYFLVWRDIIVRYKQTLLGVAWAIIEPFATMVVFTVVFGGIAKMPSDGIPYPIFFYAALVPWTFFAGALGSGATSLVDYGYLLRRIYFPRLYLPLGRILAEGVDYVLAFVVLVGMMIYYRLVPTTTFLELLPFMRQFPGLSRVVPNLYPAPGLGWSILIILGLSVFVVVSAYAVTLWLSALNVRFRDVAHAVPFLIQIWLFSTPVMYSASSLPDNIRLLYSLNPMVPVIESFRWVLADGRPPTLGMFAVSMGVTLVLLIGGLAFFQHQEGWFADVV